jgi:TRAP-type mannitol/chloroaromatic compound transport system substrate-binding protein
VSIFVLTGFFSGPARAQKAIEWKMLAPWGLTNVQIRTLFVTFVEEVNKRAAGKLKISWFGPESVPAFEQLKPVRDGVFDGNFTSFAYHTAMREEKLPRKPLPKGVEPVKTP